MSWRNFFFADRASRASDRYPAIYYEDIGKAIAAQIPIPEAVVLDYACGAAPAASLIAEHCATAYLYDSTPKMQAILRQRYAANPKVKILTEAQVRALPDGTLDMVLFNGLLQYLTLAQCTEAVDFAAAKLRLNGRLIVADVIPPHADPLSDSWALVEYAYRGGFLLAALRGALSRSRAASAPHSADDFHYPRYATAARNAWFRNAPGRSQYRPQSDAYDVSGEAPVTERLATSSAQPQADA